MSGFLQRATSAKSKDRMLQRVTGDILQRVTSKFWKINECFIMKIIFLTGSEPFSNK